MHFLMHSNTVIPGIVLVSNLRCNTTLVKSTRGQTSLPALKTVNCHSFATIQVSLLRYRLASLLCCPFRELAVRSCTSCMIRWQELMGMLIRVHLLNSVLSRFY